MSLSSIWRWLTTLISMVPFMLVSMVLLVMLRLFAFSTKAFSWLRLNWLLIILACQAFAFRNVKFRFPILQSEISNKSSLYFTLRRVSVLPLTLTRVRLTCRNRSFSNRLVKLNAVGIGFSTVEFRIPKFFRFFPTVEVLKVNWRGQEISSKLNRSGGDCRYTDSHQPT